MQAQSKGQIVIKRSTLKEDYICEIILTEETLVLNRDEYMRPKENLFTIDVRNITSFIFLNKKVRPKLTFTSAFNKIVDTALLVLLPQAFLKKKVVHPDVLVLIFVDKDGATVELTLDMLTYGENGLVKLYDKLAIRK